MILNDDILTEAKMKVTKKKHLTLTFEGYFLSLSSVPAEPGVYCIYKAKYEEEGLKPKRGELLYIGEAKNMNKRLSQGHEKLEEIIADLGTREQPCFSFAKTKDHELAEAALIYRTKPLYNDQSTGGYHKDPVVIDVEGKHHGIAPKITVDEDEIS